VTEERMVVCSLAYQADGRARCQGRQYPWQPRRM